MEIAFKLNLPSKLKCWHLYWGGYKRFLLIFLWARFLLSTFLLISNAPDVCKLKYTPGGFKKQNSHNIYRLFQRKCFVVNFFCKQCWIKSSGKFLNFFFNAFLFEMPIDTNPEIFVAISSDYLRIRGNIAYIIANYVKLKIKNTSGNSTL